MFCDYIVLVNATFNCSTIDKSVGNHKVVCSQHFLYLETLLNCIMGVDLISLAYAATIAAGGIAGYLKAGGFVFWMQKAIS